MKKPFFAIAVLAILFSPAAAWACNEQTGAREQLAVLSWDRKQVADWTVSHGEINAVDLPNGVKLGVQIDPAEPEVIERLSLRWKHVAEMVKISLYDLSDRSPRRLAYTYGGQTRCRGTVRAGGPAGWNCWEIRASNSSCSNRSASPRAMRPDSTRSPSQFRGRAWGAREIGA